MLAIEPAVLLNLLIAAGVLGTMILSGLWRLGKVFDKALDNKMEKHVDPVAADLKGLMKIAADRSLVVDAVFEEVKDEIIAVGKKVEMINGSMRTVRRDVDWLLGDKGQPLDMEISD